MIIDLSYGAYSNEYVCPYTVEGIKQLNQHVQSLLALSCPMQCCC